MESIAGKRILTTLEELVDPARTALIAVDVQNDFCSPGGAWISPVSLEMMETVLPNVRRLTNAARSAGVQVIYIQMLIPPTLETMSPSYLRFMVQKSNLSPDALACAPGTWGAEIVEEVAPQPGDLVIPKWRSSAFVGTPLDLILRSTGVESVVVCGVATQACVESTIRDAFNTDYYAVEVEDAVGSSDRQLHEASLTVMRGRVDVVPTDAVSGVWERIAAGRAASEQPAVTATAD